VSPYICDYEKARRLDWARTTPFRFDYLHRLFTQWDQVKCWRESICPQFSTLTFHNSPCEACKAQMKAWGKC